jgi:pilus assembly protein Flp/PilA
MRLFYEVEEFMMPNTLTNIVNDESGATAIEYGLIAALVSVAAILALSAMGDALRTLFERVSTELNTAVN